MVTKKQITEQEIYKNKKVTRNNFFLTDKIHKKNKIRIPPKKLTGFRRREEQVIQ